MESTTTELVIVVGERFHNVLDSRHYISYHKFLKAISGETSPHVMQPVFSPGQGLSEVERYRVHGHLSENSPHLLRKKYLRTLPSSLLHKNHQENVLITELDPLTDKEFRSELVIHNDNELLQDHISGCHIPGMVFVEATRQLSIAAWSCIENLEPHSTAMLIRDIHCEYQQFAFPFQTDIHTIITKEGANTYSMDIHFTQNDEYIAHTFGNFSTIESRSIKKLEQRQMRTAIRQKTSNLLQNRDKNYMRSA